MCHLVANVECRIRLGQFFLPFFLYPHDPPVSRALTKGWAPAQNYGASVVPSRAVSLRPTSQVRPGFRSPAVFAENRIGTKMHGRIAIGQSECLHATQ